MTPEQERKIDTLNLGVDGVIARLNRIVRTQRIRLVLIALAITLSLTVAFQARADLAHANSNTTTARIASCVSANVDRAGQRAALKADDHDFAVQLVLASGGSPDDPRIEAFDRHHGTVIDAHIPDRLCTAPGIACYLGLAPKPCRAYARAAKES